MWCFHLVAHRLIWASVLRVQAIDVNRRMHQATQSMYSRCATPHFHQRRLIAVYWSQKVYTSAWTGSQMQILFKSENKQMIKLLPLCQAAEMKLLGCKTFGTISARRLTLNMTLHSLWFTGWLYYFTVLPRPLEIETSCDPDGGSFLV